MSGPREFRQGTALWPLPSLKQSRAWQATPGPWRVGWGRLAGGSRPPLPAPFEYATNYTSRVKRVRSRKQLPFYTSPRHLAALLRYHVNSTLWSQFLTPPTSPLPPSFHRCFCWLTLSTNHLDPISTTHILSAAWSQLWTSRGLPGPLAISYKIARNPLAGGPNL
jgi:hypothetical protein